MLTRVAMNGAKITAAALLIAKCIQSGNWCQSAINTKLDDNTIQVFHVLI
jgi:hypothetical protein